MIFEVKQGFKLYFVNSVFLQQFSLKALWKLFRMGVILLTQSLQLSLFKVTKYMHLKQILSKNKNKGKCFAIGSNSNRF